MTKLLGEIVCSEILIFGLISTLRAGGSSAAEAPNRVDVARARKRVLLTRRGRVFRFDEDADEGLETVDCTGEGVSAWFGAISGGSSRKPLSYRHSGAGTARWKDTASSPSCLKLSVSFLSRAS